MTSSPPWKTYFVVAGVFLLGDFMWIGNIAEPMYTSLRLALNPGSTPSSLPFRILPAIGAYLVMTLTLVWLVLPQIHGSTPGERLLRAVWWGGLWGLAVYGVYDFTNLAIIKAFPASTAIADILWGIVIGTLAGFVGSYWMKN